MYTPETSRHFELFTDPKTGVRTWVLATQVAGQMQGFYFVNRSMDRQGRYLWFYCTNPPAAYQTLGVMDFEDDEVRAFPETECLGGASNTLIDQDTGEAIFGGPQGIFRKSPKGDRPPEKICDLPRELFKYGFPLSLGTHFTYSPDKTKIFMDARSGDHFILGALTLKDGSFKAWREYDYCRNHAQFNPAREDLALCAEDFWTDMATGTHHVIRFNDRNEFMRLWTLRPDGSETLYPPLDGQRATHEWWSRDGRILYYCKYDPTGVPAGVTGNNGIAGVNIDTLEHKVYAPVPAWHGDSSKDDTYFVYDENDVFYRGTPSRVGFYNAVTKKQLYIVSQNAALASRDCPSHYHLDPHPHLVADDRYVCHTLAQKGYPQVALTPTDQLLEATR